MAWFTAAAQSTTPVSGGAGLPAVTNPAQGQRPSSGDAPPLGSLGLTNIPALREISPGVFELGRVRLNKAKRAVTFAAGLNLSSGGMEYLLVTSEGKLHESVLRTGVSPLEIHLALLLLGARGGNAPEPVAPPPQYGGVPGLEVAGDPVAVEVSWREGEHEVRRGAEELAFDSLGATSMAEGRWVYNGSAVWHGRFLAQDSGSIIALIPDPVSLVNFRAKTRSVEQAWKPREAMLPPTKTPVQITIRLLGVVGPKSNGGGTALKR